MRNFSSKNNWVIMVMDAQGQRSRRFCVRPVMLYGFILGFVVMCCGAMGLLLHGLSLSPQAHLAQQISQQNQQQAQLLQHIDELDMLPQLRQLTLHNEHMFAQLWAQSNLGVDSQLLLTEDPNDNPLPKELKSNVEISLNHELATQQLTELKHQALNIQGLLAQTREYFHDAQQLLASTPSIRPARTAWLTSSFGKRRDPIYHVWLMHKGLDLGGPHGTKVYAPADGVVIWTGPRGGYGLTVVIDHGYGLQTHFAHLSHYAVKTGQKVHRGQAIAAIGSTGKSTGPHLHYEVRRLGEPLDPRRFILD